MKIIRQTSDRLTVRLLPWLMWAMGGGFAASGLPGAALTWQRSELHCDRSATPQCELNRASLFTRDRTEFAIASLRSAVVETTLDSDGDELYRLALLTDRGHLLFTRPFTGGEGRYNQHAASINRFLASPQELTLHVQHRGYGVALVCLLVFVLPGLAVATKIAKIVVWDFDRSRRQFTLTRWNLLTRERREYPFQRIVGLRLARSDNSDNGYSHYIELLLKEGESVPLTHHYGANQPDPTELIGQISMLMGLPILAPWDADNISEQLAGTIAELVSGGNDRQQTAIAECVARLRQDPDDADAYCTQAAALTLQGKRAQARNLLDSGQSYYLSQGKPDQAMRLDQLGQYYGLKT